VAARYGHQVFIRFDDEILTYRQANETVNPLRRAVLCPNAASDTADVGGHHAEETRRAWCWLMLAGGETGRDRRAC